LPSGKLRANFVLAWLASVLEIVPAVSPSVKQNADASYGRDENHSPSLDPTNDSRDDELRSATRFLWSFPMFRRFSVLLVAAIPISLGSAADPTIIDGTGKEIVLKNWKITAGTRKLEWLPDAPEALVFREVNSTTFREGVLTFILLDRLESLSYDIEKKTVKAKVAGIEQPLEGSIRYQGINQIVIEAEVDKGAAGVVELKYRGGALAGGIRGIKFTGAKAGPKLAGDRIFVAITDGNKKEAAEPVYGLQALYRIEKTEKTLPWVMFKKTFKADVAKIKKMSLREQPDQKLFECDVTLDDDSQQTLSLLTTVTADGKPATLAGLVGVVPAGYKLFPMHTIGEISKSEPKAPPEKLGPKKKEMP
jgi:hypothetical protein